MVQHCTHYCLQCVVPENIHTHLKEDNWKFQGGGGLKSQILSKESRNQNWNFQQERWKGEVKQNTLHGRGMNIFRTMQMANLHHVSTPDMAGKNNIAGEEFCFTSEILCATISGLHTQENVQTIGHNVAPCVQALTISQRT